MVIFGLIDHPAAPEIHRGAFIVFCAKTLRYSYAYPSSPNATSKDKEQTVRSMLDGAYEAEGETLALACMLLQYMTNPKCLYCTVGAAGWVDIAYDMDRAEKNMIPSHIGCDSAMSDALRIR